MGALVWTLLSGLTPLGIAGLQNLYNKPPCLTFGSLLGPKLAMCDLQSVSDQRQIGGRTWPVLVPGGCRRSGKGVYNINFGGQLYQGVSDHLKGSKPVSGQLYCLQKLIRDRLEVAHGQFWSQEAAEGQARGFIILILEASYTKGCQTT